MYALEVESRLVGSSLQPRLLCLATLVTETEEATALGRGLKSARK